MSGTSADGIDAVVAQISGHGRSTRARVLAHAHRPFTRGLRLRILEASLHGTVREICELNFVLGEHFARAALAVLRVAKLEPNQIVAIGSHGQTVHHLPGARRHSTLQIGEAAVIAERTGITTVADFRVGDVAAGGQGAPLAPYADWALFTDRAEPRIVQNIGGIANLTFLPADAGLEEVLAFDTGPGNMLIDGLVAVLSAGRKSFDRDGRWAAQGTVSSKLLARLMTHPFLRRKPPKTTGREEFGEPLVQDILMAAGRLQLAAPDVVATATAFTTSSIVQAYRRFVFPRLKSGPSSGLQIILGGGGARNPTLRGMLQAQASPYTVLTHEDFGIADCAKEALAFAILARETMSGRPGNLPSATGARRPAILGKIIQGSLR